MTSHVNVMISRQRRSMHAAADAAGHGRPRKSVGPSRASGQVACKVSTWRNPRDKPRASGAHQQDGGRAPYEGPDQELAVQLERWAAPPPP